MDLGYTEEQELLKNSAKNFLSNECPKELVKEINETDEGYSKDIWKKMVDLGWMGLPFPEEYGGSNCSFLDLTILLEEMGYNILPGPYFSTMVLGALPILDAGSKEQKQDLLPRIANGEIILTMALAEPDVSYEASSIKTKAENKGEEFIINGTKMFVPDAHIADYILCVAKTDEKAAPDKGITVFIVDAKQKGVECTLLKTMAYDKQNEVVFNNVVVKKENILGELNKGWSLVQDILQKAAVAKCAEMVGGAQAAMDMAVQYAKDRVQFDRPIGSFQAIQHYCANMVTDVDGARYITNEAAWRITEGLSVAKEASMTKAWVGDAYQRVTLLAHQIFGAMGFTMEHDLHLYYRLASASAQAFGDSNYHRELVAQELNL